MGDFVTGLHDFRGVGRKAFDGVAGINQVDLMSYFFSSARIRRAPIRPNSPRDMGVGVVRPRAIQIETASKSKVRQTIRLGILTLRSLKTKTADKRTCSSGHDYARRSAVASPSPHCASFMRDRRSIRMALT
jgi:hypothetical protein